MINQTFNVISADPPWNFKPYGKQGDQSRTPDRHYPTLNTKELGRVNVPSLAAKNCALLMWSSGPFLAQSLELGKAWGFEYKTMLFIWLKRSSEGRAWHFGNGYYTHANAEPVLLFTRGRIGRVSAAVAQIIDEYHGQMELWDSTIVARVRRHSEKPEEYFNRVNQLFGENVPKVELFARRTRPGWTCIGNEIDGSDIRDVLGYQYEARTKQLI